VPKGIPLTEEEKNRRQEEIFQSAAELILKQGFTNTSMQAIARAVGVGKSTLYDYFPDKEHLLLFIYDAELDLLQKQAENIAGKEISAIEKLSQILTAQLEYLLKNKNFFVDITIQAARIGQKNQEHIKGKRYLYQDLLKRVLDQGVTEGLFRPVNTRLAARMLISIIEILVYTTRPTGTPREMLPDALDIFLNGIKQ
jgi:TetR/AcrR family transcriptional regulator, cholesterol catabolism regulator